MEASDSPLVTSKTVSISQRLNQTQGISIKSDEYVNIALASESPLSEVNPSQPSAESLLRKANTNANANPINPFPPSINTNLDNDTPTHSTDMHYIAMSTLSPMDEYITHIPYSLYLYIVSITSTFKFTWSYVVSQLKRTPRSFYIGCSTIVIVVAFISLLYNTIDKAGLVFLKLAEVKVGENDLIIQNSMGIRIQQNNITLPMIMNYTAIHKNIYNYNNTNEYIKGSTPRWIVPSLIKLKDDETKNSSVLTQIINSTNEKAMDLSRSWKYDELLNNEVYLTRSVMRHLGFKHKEDIIGEILKFSIGDALSMISNMMNASNSENDEQTNTDDPDTQSAVHMAEIIYLIADASGVDLYPSFGNAPDIDSQNINRHCYTNDGMQYYGSESFTKSGLECQSWFSDIPHNITYHTTQYSDNLQYNFCRNPNNALFFSIKPWCYTVSNKPSLEKETCNIANCKHNYTQCLSNSYRLKRNEYHKLSYKQVCKSGIILSISFAYFGLFDGDGCDEYQDIFIHNYCYKNMTQYLYNECIGKYECVIDDLLQGLNTSQYFAQCPLYDLYHDQDVEFEFKFISEIECNFPYEWDQKVYMNDTMTNSTITLMQEIPWFILPFDVEDNNDRITDGLSAIRGKTLSIDQLRWIIMISTLSNFDFNVEFVVRDIIAEPDGKWSEAFGGVMLVESQFVQHYIDHKLSAELDKIEMYLEIVNYIISNYTENVSQNNKYDTEEIVRLFISGTFAVSKQHNNPNKAKDENRMSTYFAKFKMNDFAQMTIINHMDRLNIYRLDYNNIRSAMAEFGNKLTLSLYTQHGTTNYLSSTVRAPILSAMKILSFLKILLNSITTSMTVIIAILSCIVIYCLMIIDVENKTFECGVLRSIGMMKTSVIYILNLKSLLFCVPGIIIGLMLSCLSNIPISTIIANYVTIDPEYMLSLPSVLISSLLFGLIIPVISGIIPLRKALSTTLSSSLNLYLNTQDQVLITMINHNQYDINFMNTIIAILLILIAFVCLYLIPYCVVTQNFPIFFTVFDLIFLALLFGLGIIAMTIQNRLDDMVCTLLMSWGPQKKIRFLVHKNIYCHKNRNNKTGIMLIISSAFIVFSGCMVELQSDNFESLFKVLSGADIVFQSMGGWYDLPEYELRKTFESKSSFEKVYDYTFVTWSIDKQGFNGHKHFSFGPLGREYATSIKNHLVAVEENYCNVAFCDDYFVITDMNDEIASDDNFPKDPIAGLYYSYNRNKSTVVFPPKGIISGHLNTALLERNMESSKNALKKVYSNKINILISSAMKKACGVAADIALKVNVRFRRPDGVFYYLRHASSPVIASKVPGFYFSKHAQVAEQMTVLTTTYEFNYLLDLLKKAVGKKQSKHLTHNETHRFPYNLKKHKLLIRMKNNTNQQDRTEIIDLISSLLLSDHFFVTDTKKTINGINKTTDLLSMFFKFVAALTMSLCFFISFISFKQNVHENIYQFGVLRSIGLNKWSIVSIFVAESIIITITSLFCGTIIGITQSVSITLQSQILTENIFIFKFPTNLYLTLIASSLIIAIASSVLPSIVLIKTAPAHILRL